MPGTLKERVAIVTGGGRGIGKAIARGLAREGAAVVIAGRSAETLEEARAEIEKACGGEVRVVAVPTDVAEEAAIQRLIARVQRTFGRLDILVNNAGLAVNKPFEQTTTGDWDLLMAVNARGPFLLCRECLPLLRESDAATIINIASVVGIKGYAEQAAYTASKHALMGMTKVLAQEVQKDGIRVHSICPGGVATDMVRRMRPDIPDDVLMRPEEIAEIVLFLLTHRGNAVIDDIHIRRAASAPWF